MRQLVLNLRGLHGAKGRRFGRHYVEMVVVMLVSMMVFAPLWYLVASVSGWSWLLDRADSRVLTMAANMTVGMSLWMRWRGHGWKPIAEMGAAMFLPFLALLGPLWAGVLSESAVLGLGHVLMLLAMAVVMLFRPDEYTHSHSHVRSRSSAGETEHRDDLVSATAPR